MSDEIHQQQRALRGVARTKLAFTSDRDGERMKGPVAERGISNIYISDYDGANQQRVTVHARRSTSRRPGRPTASRSRTPRTAAASRTSSFSTIYEGTLREAGERLAGEAELPAGVVARRHQARVHVEPRRQQEIYVVNRDGSGLRRLTNHPAIDVTPTWSPTGNQIAFTSDRTGSPQIWVMNATASELQQITSESWCDRPTWSPAPFNEIAYASQHRRRLRHQDFRLRDAAARTITDGIGSNESPAFSPNGRHLAFTSTRAGKEQIFVIDRDGKNLRQITQDRHESLSELVAVASDARIESWNVRTS